MFYAFNTNITKEERNVICFYVLFIQIMKRHMSEHIGVNCDIRWLLPAEKCGKLFEIFI